MLLALVLAAVLSHVRLDAFALVFHSRLSSIVETAVIDFIGICCFQLQAGLNHKKYASLLPLFSSFFKA